MQNDKLHRLLARLLAFGVLAVMLAACNDMRDRNVVLDAGWADDVKNLVMATVEDADNAQFTVRKKPQYAPGSPYRTACVEVAQPAGINRFYIVNLGTYGMTEVRDCEDGYREVGNLLKPKAGKGFDLDSWLAVQDDVEAILRDDDYVRLGFSNLFPVGEYHITPKGKSALLTMIERLEYQPVKRIVVYGIADSSGSYRMDAKLAQARATRVRDFLVEEGLNYVPISIRASVESRLNTAEQRAQQRRFLIEITLTKHEQ